MANEIKLTFAGDATALQKANKQAEESTLGVGAAATQANKDTADFASRMGSLGSTVTGANDAIMGISDGLNALVDFQGAAAERASRLARAQADVEQAMIDAEQAAVDLEQATRDLAQSQLDSKQAGVDAKQAQIDVRQAYHDARVVTEEYNAAVKEYGRSSNEAVQAAIDLDRANADLSQANLDAEQAQEDLKQAQLDGKQATVDATQAARDAKDAQLDLNDAQREANPTDLQKFMDQLNLVTPLLSALVGVVALVTAAQWAWNIAQMASPTTWIVLAIAALVAVIVLIATKTDWFQRLWKAAWKGIMAYLNFVKNAYVTAFNLMIGIGKRLGDALWAIPGLIKKAWSGLFNILTWPFRTAFNFISDAWNNTVGQLSWSVPGWVPLIGGNSISAPRLPKFHTGGVASGAFGGEFMAVLRAGERVTPTAGGSSGGQMAVRVEAGGGGTSADRMLAEIVLELIRKGVIKLAVLPNGRVAVAG